MTRHAFRTDHELRQLRDRHRDEQFAAAWAAVQKRTERSDALGLHPLDRAAGWGHDFYCPTHSVPLTFDPASPHRHRCPAGEHALSGAKFDGGWRTAYNGRILDGARAHAVSWLVTGQRHHLDYPRAVLLDWADRYPELPPTGTLQGKAKVEGISLSEAVWALSCAQIYADIASGIAPEDRSRIQGLLGQAADFLGSQLMRKLHNIECWHLAALASLGAVLEDPNIIELAVDGDFGLQQQFQSGIRDDGWWTEGSPHYHFYMLRPVLSAALALRQQRPEIAGSPRLQEMTLAPLKLLRPDLSLPAFNDGWEDISHAGGLAGQADHYELAWALWQQPEAIAALQAIYATGQSGGPQSARDSESALGYGPDLDGMEPADLPPVQRIHAASGYAVLADLADTAQPGNGRRLCAVLKYGPHGGGHGHPDKLQLDLHALGVRIAPDLGSPAYNSPLQGPWIRQTLSHNTATIAGQSQPISCGRLLSADSDPSGWQRVEAAVSWPDQPAEVGDNGAWLAEKRHDFLPAYAGAGMRRLVLAGPKRNYLLDVFTVVQAGTERIDLAWREPGTLVDGDQLTPAEWHPLTAIQEQLTDPRAVPGNAGDAGGARSLGWRQQGVTSRLWFPESPVEGESPVAAARKTESPSALVLRGPGISVDQHQELLLRSSHASQVCFPAVIEFCADDQPGLDTVVFDQQPGCLRVTVDHAEGRDELVITEGARPGLVVTRESSPPAAPEQNRIEVAVAADEVPLVTYRD